MSDVDTSVESGGITGVGGQVSQRWVLSEATLPVGKSGAVGVKLDGSTVMWLGGIPDNPADQNRTFLYDVDSQAFREAAPVPVAKPMDLHVAVGVLPDGSVIVAGGTVQASGNDGNVRSYRYLSRHDTWVRTGDLPEPQQWTFTPSVLLRDGRLLVAGGMGPDGIADGIGSIKAFVFDLEGESQVPEVDPHSGTPTGRIINVQGRWDYTKTAADHAVSNLGRGHVFGHAVLLHDGRVFVVGGHTVSKLGGPDATSTLAVDTDYFDPRTGVWSTGAPLPPVKGPDYSPPRQPGEGEDDSISGSNGGRTNGVGVSVMDNGKVVIAGGNTQTDGTPYFMTAKGRRSILVMTPAPNPLHSTYQILPDALPASSNFGGLFGDGGRNQLLCYAHPGNRVVIAGGQSSVGEDLYDTYLFNSETREIVRGPDLVHHAPVWAQDPQSGYPAGYEAAVISTQAVSMNNSRLVFREGVLVHGGGYDGVGDAQPLGSRRVEQLHRGPRHQHDNPPAQPTDAQRAAARDRYRRRTASLLDC